MRITSALILMMLSFFNTFVLASQSATAPDLEGGFYGSVGTFYAVPSGNTNGTASRSYNAPSSDLGPTQNQFNQQSNGQFGTQGTLGYVFPKSSNGAEISSRSVQ